MYIEVSYDGKHIEKVNFPCDIYNIFTTIDYNYFRVPIDFMDNWNAFVEEEWCGLDDCDFYNNIAPTVNSDDWYYYRGRDISTAEDYLETAKAILYRAETFFKNMKRK